MARRPALLLPAAAFLAACGGSKGYSRPVTAPASIPSSDVIACARKVLEADGYKLGRVDQADGFLEATRLQRVGATPDVQLFQVGDRITVRARPGESGALTTVEISAIGIKDRRTYAGPREETGDPTPEGLKEVEKVRGMCTGEPAPAGR